MRWYPDRIPDWLSRALPAYHWHGARDEKLVYLTFDDGPTPVVTDFVLQQLAVYQFKATFFLIGDRAQRYPQLLHEVIASGHGIGNHTYNHHNAWKHTTASYVENVLAAGKVIDSLLFRPPYGRITPGVTRELTNKGFHIVLWDVLSGDFDTKRSAENCLKNLKTSTRNGSIIVFHDSKKSYPLLKDILPIYLEWLQVNGYRSAAI